MLKPLLAWATSTLILLMSAVLLIHSQPLDDGGMQDLLFPTDCPAPCFLGILPGVTGVEAAEAHLEAQGLVGEWLEKPDTIVQTDEVGMGFLRWRWSSLRPDSLTALEASLAYDRSSRRVLTFGRVTTDLPLWVLLVSLGKPALGFMSGGYNDRDRPVFIHVASYPQWRFNLLSYVQCPMTLQALWESQVSIEMSNITGEYSRFDIYPDDVKPIMGRAAAFFC